MRHAGQQGHIVQPKLGDPAQQPGFVCPLADEREMDRLTGQPGGSVGDTGQPVRDPVRPHIQHQAVTSARSEAIPHLRVGRDAGSEPVKGDAVADRVHLVVGHPPADEVGTEPVAHHDDLVRGGVRGEFEPFQRSDQPPVGQHAELDEDSGPQVADLDHQPGPLHLGQQPGGADGEEGRRGHNDRVGRPAAPPAQQHAADHEAEMARRLPRHAFVGRGVQPGPDHPVAVPAFPAPDRAPVGGGHQASRVVRHAGQHGHRVAVRGPGCGQRGQPGLRGACFGREVVGHYERAHLTPAPAEYPGAPAARATVDIRPAGRPRPGRRRPAGPAGR